MGYEVKIYCGTINTPNDEGSSYMQVVAMIDLCKVPIIRPSKTGTAVYLYYESDGDTPRTEDKYGDRLRAVPLSETLEAVRKAQKTDPSYRRYAPAIALLESLQNFEGDDIYCVVFGY